MENLISSGLSELRAACLDSGLTSEITAFVVIGVGRRVQVSSGGSILGLRLAQKSRLPHIGYQKLNKFATWELPKIRGPNMDPKMTGLFF